MEPFDAIAVGFDVRNIRELYHSSQVMRARQNVKQLNVLKASRKIPVLRVPQQCHCDSLDQIQRLFYDLFS
jgi:hypothetical protein